MANKKVSELTAADPLIGSEVIHIVQSGNSRKTPLSAIVTYFLTKVSVWSKPQRKAVVSVSPVANVFNPDFASSPSFDLGTLTANSTLEGGTNGPGAVGDQAGEITVDLDGFTLTIDADDWDFPDGTAPTLAGKCTLYYRFWHDGSTLHKRVLSVSNWG